MKKTKTKLSRKKVIDIEKAFAKSVPKFFGENILFGFICGSVARQYDPCHEDIDIFVCLKRNLTKVQKKAFHTWYIDIHKKYGLNPDLRFPGEVMTHRLLLQRIALAQKWKPSLTITKLKMYDGVTWVDMLTGSQIGHIGMHAQFLRSLRKKYSKFPKAWGRVLMKQLSKQQQKQVRNLPVSIFLKNFVIFTGDKNK